MTDDIAREKPRDEGAAASLGARLSRARSVAARGLADLLSPPACPGCGADTGSADALCGACWRETMFLAGPGCVSCGRPEPALPAHDPAFRCDLCLACPPDWDTVRGVALYRGGVRRMILRLKHGDRLDIVPAMARMMARAGRREIARADLVVPVPLHWTRRLARRFNQSAELAREACRIAGRRDAHAPTLLRRIRATESQEGKTREERLRNLDGAFALPRPRAVAGRRILLVDDVMTTGATVGSAARTLKAAGAARVDVLAMALVPAPSLAYLGTDETRSAGADPSAPGMERRSDA